MQIQGDGITAKRVYNPDNYSCEGCVFRKKSFCAYVCAKQHDSELGYAATAAEALVGADCKSHNYIWARVS